MNEMNLNYFNPTRIVSGSGCLKKYKAFSDIGKKCFIVTGKTSAKKSGALDDAIEALENSGTDYMIFDEIENNPTNTTCKRGGNKAHEFGADFILGIGGGSPLDAAKAIAIFATNPVLSEIDIFDKPFAKRPLPIVCVATTVGTGSEVTPLSILTVHSLGTKKMIKHDHLFPKISFLDPMHAMSLPKNVVAATATDALSHAIEGYFSKNTTIMTNTYAEAAMRLLAPGLLSLSNNGYDYDLISELMYGSTLAGKVISATGTCSVHSMGYPLTYHFDVPHGEANAYFLPQFVRKMATVSPVRSMKVLKFCNFTGIDQMSNLFDNLLPLDIRLTDAQIDEFTAEVMTTAHVKNSVTNMTENDIREMYSTYRV